jgi:phosphorylase kinase alpha/beta subunit
VQRIETEDTARLYRLGEQTLAFTTAVLEDGISYLADDPLQLEDSVVDELHLLRRHWRGPGLPLLLIPVSAESFQHHPEVFLQLGQTLLSGRIGDIPVQFDQLKQLAIQASWVTLREGGVLTSSRRPWSRAEPLCCRTPQTSAISRPLKNRSSTKPTLTVLRRRLWNTQSLHEQADVLDLLQRRFGAKALETSPHGRSVTIQQLLEEVYHRGLRCQDWSVVRRCAGAMGMVHPQLEDALTDLLVRQKQGGRGPQLHRRCTAQPPPGQQRHRRTDRTHQRGGWARAHA